MANEVRFLVTSVLDSASIWASSSASGLPASNVQDDMVRKVWRSTADDTEYLRFDVGAATTIDAAFVANHNLSRDATVVFEGNTTSNFTGCSLSVTMDVATDTQGNVVQKLAYFFSAPMTYQHFRVHVQDAGNSDGQIDIGRVMAGSVIEPERNLREGFEIRTIDPSRGKDTAGRQTYWTVRTQYEELTYNVDRVDEAQADEMMGIFAEVGRHTPFMIALDPEKRPIHNTWYVQFTTDVRRRHAVVRDYNLQEVVLQEKN